MRASHVWAAGAAVAIGAWVVAVSAQEPGQMPPGQTSVTQGVVRKGKVPVSSDVIRTVLPRPVNVDLPNGMHLMVLEDHRLPQVSFDLFIPGAGGYYDPADQVGLASTAAALMREGTATQTSEQISQKLEVMAATLSVSAGTSGLDATVSGSALTEQFAPLLDIATDVLLHPAFAEQELARYKQRLKNQLVQQRANPGLLGQELVQRVIYGDHPASRLTPSVAALDQTTREGLVAFHQARYVPDHAVLAVAGDITPGAARALIEARLGGWPRSGVAEPKVTNPTPTAGPRIAYIGRPNSVQTVLLVASQAIERTNPDYHGLQLMNKVLGGGPTGRLFIHLREEKGYTYGIDSSVNAPTYRGEWMASTSVRTEVTEAALRDLLAEIAMMRDTPVSDQELADAKRALTASFALSLESPGRLLGYHVNQRLYGLPADYWDHYAERVNAVTKEQVQAAARKYLAPERLQIVAVGDPVKLPEVLKKLGSVEAWDADGKRIPPAEPK